MMRSLFAILVGLALAGTPLAAQQSRCSGCADSVERVDYARALERERSRVRAQLAQVRSQLAAPNLDVHVEKALREAESKILLYDRELRLRLAYTGGTVQGVRVQALRRPADGYLGVTYSGNQIVVSTADGLVAHHADYPVIESVEPGSPAYRAGLEAGDTVIAYNSEDLLRQDIILSKLLKPGAQLRVTVRRNGNMRDVDVLVGRRPQTLGADILEVTVPSRTVKVVSSGTPVAPKPPKGKSEPAPPQPTNAPTPPAPTGPVIWGPSATSAIAGAEIVRLNEALGETFGVKAGVLILNVGNGTPAERAGLRGGDVIVSANGNPVTAPQALSLAVRRARDRQVSLEIIRKTRKQTLVLRW
jgi:serine protease Do